MPVLRLEQVGEFDGRPIYLRSAFLPLYDVEDLRERVLCLDADPPPFADAFSTLFGVPAGPVEASVTASPAGRSVARHLGVDRGSPVLVREMVLRDASGRLRELSTTYCRGDAISMTSGAGEPPDHGP
jgi:GntR family transcriptional regulator